MRIFINPGHGGGDSGACGHGLIERDVAFNIGKLVRHYLRAVGYDVMLFQFDGLNTICQQANAYDADIFVSIHCNSGDGIGAETYESGYSEASFKLAQAIQKQLVDSLPLVDRGVKSANFAVLRGTDMPAVLVETAFIDNFDDAQLLRDRQDDFARAIARGITDFFMGRLTD